MPHLYICTENDIDGDALVMLLKNFEEFHHLVPKSAIRMKIKHIILQHCNESPQVCVQADPSPPHVQVNIYIYIYIYI